METTKGQWILTEDRQPTAPGDYLVKRRRGLRVYDDHLYWNGGYWITPGHSPTTAVHAWWDESEKDEH